MEFVPEIVSHTHKKREKQREDRKARQREAETERA